MPSLQTNKVSGAVCIVHGVPQVQTPLIVAKPLAHGWRMYRATPLRALHQCCAATQTSSSSPQLCAFASPTGLRAASQKFFLRDYNACQRQKRHLAAPLPDASRSRRTSPPAALPEFFAAVASSPYRDYYVLVSAFLGALLWVKMFKSLAANGILEQKLSRKLVHTTSGPLFVLTWTLFSADPSTRFSAALVPFLNFTRLALVGSGLVSDPGLVKSVSRSGDRTELLKGPLYYVVTLIAATILCWRDNPAGLIAVAMMCGGDGLADIVGRRWGGSAKLPYNSDKSWAGTLAMLLGGYGLSYGLIVLFCSQGFFSCYPPASMVSCLGAVALAATFVESLPINRYVDDNVSVPLVAAALSQVLLPQPVDPSVLLGTVAVVGAAAAAAPAVPELEMATTAAAAAAATAVQVGLSI